MTTPPTLAYAPATRRRWRRWAKVVVVLTVFCSALYYAPRIYRWTKARAHTLSMQRKCLTFSPPATAVVYADQQKSGPAQDLLPYDRTMNNQDNPEFRGSKLFSFMRATSAMDWLALPVQRRDNATLFLHERHTPDRRRMIVGVKFGEDGRYRHLVHADWPMTFIVYIAEPIGWFTPATIKERRFNVPIGEWPAPSRDVASSQSVVFYAGQPDPADASRFTIAYAIGDRPGIIDGVLNDNLSVLLSPRTGPLATSPTKQEAR